MGDNKHPVYGKIPDGWKVKKIEEICDREKGVQTGPFGSQLHKDDYKPVGTPIITVEHLGENRIIHRDLPLVSDEDKERLNRYWMKEGDIIFSRVGSVDRRALVRKEEDGWLFSGRCLRIRPDKNQINPQYLSYFMGRPNFKEHLQRIAVGATMPSLNTQILSETEIVVPPLPEQRRIAHILGTLDDKIELNRRMNATLEAMARALFKSWFVDFDPVRAKAAGRPSGLPAEIEALFPDSFVDSELGEIPRGWEVVELKNAVGLNEKTVSKDFRFDEIKYVEISDVSKGELTKMSTYKWTEAPSRARRAVKHGDVIWSTVRPNRRAFYFVHDPPENLIVSTGFATLSPRKVGPCFLYNLVTTDDFVTFLTRNADGAAYPAIRVDRIGEAKFVLPTEKFLVSFEEVVCPIRNIAANSRSQNRALEMIRDALMPRLMRGEM